MKKIRKLKRGNNEYAYEEVWAKWDSDKQQCRKELKYLGKVDPVSGKVIPKKKTKSIPKSVIDYGLVYFFEKVVSKLRLEKALKASFSEQEAELLLALSFYKLAEEKAFYLYSNWAKQSGIIEQSSQRISEFVKDIGSNHTSREDFFVNWSREVIGGEPVMFDITSLSSYSEQIEFVEYGYNRDKEKLEQINLGIVATTLPVAYRIYPGSINDVTTLKNMLGLLRTLKLDDDAYFVMDKGFYSAKNVEECHKAKYSYIIPMSFSTKEAANLVEANYDELVSAHTSFIYNGKHNTHFICKRVKVGKVHTFAHIYLNPTKKTEALNNFMKRINEFEELFYTKSFDDIDEVKLYIQQSFGKGGYFNVKKIKEGFMITRNSKQIEKRVKLMGTFILLSRSKLSAVDMLDLYRGKDSIEKVFNDLKNSLKEDRIRNHSQDTMHGKIFILFIALIIFTFIKKTAKEEGLLKNFTINQIFGELKKMKTFLLADGTKIITEATKKQKIIFKAFGIKTPVTSL